MVLKNNYIPFWGPIYVAGKEFSFQARDQCFNFDIVIEGFYTISSTVSAKIDDQIFIPGDNVYLKPGSHNITTQIAPSAVTLIWGKNLYKPERPAPASPLFTGF